jgi:L-alanine-DL-glutamate epimerase-like enolase superfamily enzyme
MEINKITIYNLRIPFSRTIRHRLYSRSETQSIVVVLQDHHGNKGVGEGTPRGYVTGEALDTSLDCAKVLSQKVIGQNIESVSQLYTLLDNLGSIEIAHENPAAFCALETALLDLWSRLAHTTLYRLFKIKSKMEQLSYSGVIPYSSSETELLKVVELIKFLKLRTLKVKVVDLDSGVSQLKIIREKLGSDIDIRVDANAAFEKETALAFIKAAKAIRLSAIEQPVAKADLTGLKHVSDNSDIPVIADESMYTPKGPFYLIDNNICHGLNIRLSSCGGFRKAHYIYQQAKRKHMMVVLGAHVGETAILSFAGRHLAMMCPEATYLEGSFSKYVLKEDLVNEDISFGAGGAVPVPIGSGLGIDIESGAIENWSTRFSSISTPGGPFTPEDA